MASICRSFLAGGLSYKESAFPSIAVLGASISSPRNFKKGCVCVEEGVIPQIMDIPALKARLDFNGNKSMNNNIKENITCC